jgi:hypothetical protein
VVTTNEHEAVARDSDFWIAPVVVNGIDALAEAWRHVALDDSTWGTETGAFFVGQSPGWIQDWSADSHVRAFLASDQVCADKAVRAPGSAFLEAAPRNC